MNDTMLSKAKQPLAMVKLYVKQSKADEAELFYAAYSIHQSIEYSLKHVIEMNGLRFPHDHHIIGLLAFIDAKCEKRLSSELTGDLFEMAAIITDWALRSRYIKGYLVYYNQLMKGVSLAERIIAEAERLSIPETTTDSSTREELTKEFS